MKLNANTVEELHNALVGLDEKSGVGEFNGIVEVFGVQFDVEYDHDDSGHVVTGITDE